jgi:hypothetical protein
MMPKPKKDPRLMNAEELAELFEVQLNAKAGEKPSEK